MVDMVTSNVKRHASDLRLRRSVRYQTKVERVARLLAVIIASWKFFRK
jgi:hypothetical protein